MSYAFNTMKMALLLFAVPLVLLSCSSSPEPAPNPIEPEGDTPAAAVPSPEDERPVILAFGNSLTAGYGLPPGSGYPAQLQAALDAKNMRYRVVNAGVSGDTTSGALVRLHAGLRYQPKIVILELGANDGLRGLPVDQMRSNLEEMIVAFQNAGSRVVLAGMTLPLNYGEDYVRDFEKTFVELADRYNLTLIPFFLEGVAGDAGLTLEDRMHPNRDGYRIVSENVFRFVGPLLDAPH